jgi:hypothetical protein
MPYTATIDVIPKPPVEVSQDTAELLNEVHPALAGLPADRAANVDFPGLDEVKRFLTEAKAHAESLGWRFTRVGDIKGQPNRVSFRVVTKRATDPTAETPEAASDASASAPAMTVATSV